MLYMQVSGYSKYHSIDQPNSKHHYNIRRTRKQIYLHLASHAAAFT